jgi:hypothetical protein
MEWSAVLIHQPAGDVFGFPSPIGSSGPLVTPGCPTARVVSTLHRGLAIDTQAFDLPLGGSLRLRQGLAILVGEVGKDGVGFREFLGVGPGALCADGSRCDCGPLPSGSVRVSSLPGILGRATAPTLPPPSAACPVASCGRSDPVGCRSPPTPTALAPPPGVALPKAASRRRRLVRPRR